MALAVVLALLTLAVSSLVTSMGRRWFEHDVGVRSSLGQFAEAGKQLELLRDTLRKLEDRGGALPSR